MNIISFKISDDKSNLTLIVDEATEASELYLWTNKTYKIEELKIDLSVKLDGTINQTIVITPEELELPYFDGVYFIEISSPTDTLNAIEAETTRYKECILDKVLGAKECNSCLEIEQPQVLNTQTLLTSLGLALEEQLPQQIITLVYALDRICGDGCKSCGEFKRI